METDAATETDSGLEASNAQTAESTESQTSAAVPAVPSTTAPAETQAPQGQTSETAGGQVIAPPPEQLSPTVEAGPGV